MPLIGLSAGTTTISTNASALGALGCTEVLVQADPANTALAFVGSVSNQTLKLSGGATVTLPCSNLSDVYAKTSAGSATLNWLANCLRN
jgi:hypothetical protein